MAPSLRIRGLGEVRSITVEERPPLVFPPSTIQSTLPAKISKTLFREALICVFLSIRGMKIPQVLLYVDIFRYIQLISFSSAPTQTWVEKVSI